jgi:hypothetical protein
MIDLEHLGRLLLIIIAAAASISFLAWLIKRFLGVDTTARQTGILIGGIAGLLAGFRLAYDFQRAALVSGIIVVGFFGTKLFNDL